MSPKRPRPNSTRRRARPKRAPSPHCNVDQVEGKLQETRSILACAVRCLDELIDPSQLDAPEEIDAMDVGVVIRVGIERLNEARRALDGLPAASGETP
jgi:hypothetical protein